MRSFFIGMSDNEDDVHSYMTNHAIQVAESYVNLLLTQESICSSYAMKNLQISILKQKIVSYIFEVSKLHDTDMFPTKGQLFSWAYEEIRDRIKDPIWVASIIDNYRSEHKVNTTIDSNALSFHLDQFCSEYFAWLSHHLSIRGQVPFKSALEKLNTLFE